MARGLAATARPDTRIVSGETLGGSELICPSAIDGKVKPAEFRFL